MSEAVQEASSKDVAALTRKKKKLKARPKNDSGAVNGHVSKPPEGSLEELELEELIRSLTFGPSGSPRMLAKAKLNSEQEAALEAEAPELAGVFRGLGSRLVELCKGNIDAASKHVASPDFAMDSGMPLMTVKIQLLMSYLTSLSYYILLKTQGVAVSDHPVVPQLVWLRTLQEKIRPLEQRLQYQMRKLLEMSEAPLPSDDPKNLRPGQLVASVENALEEENEEDAAEDEKKADDEVYKPPKVTGVEYTGDHVSAIERAERQVEKAKKRLENSEMMRSLREEFTDAPVEVQGKVQSREESRIKRKLDEKLEFEEENMTRIRLSRKEKKDVQRVLKEKRGSGTTSLDEIYDFGSFAAQMEKDQGSGILGKSSGKGAASQRRASGSRSALQAYKDSTEKVNSLKRAVMSAKDDGQAAKKKKHRMK